MTLSAAMVLSGIPKEDFTGILETLFEQGAVLIRNPSPISSIDSDESFGDTSPEKHKKCDDIIKRPSQPVPIIFIDLIDGLSDRFFGRKDYWKVPTKPKTIIMHGNRNILDLADNLQSEWPLRPAELKKGASNFFENRSQLSRLDGARLPPHIRYPCKDLECSFNECIYY